MSRPSPKAASRTTVSLSDEEIRSRLPLGSALEVVRRSMLDAEAGTFIAPARVHEDADSDSDQGRPRRGPIHSVARGAGWYGYASTEGAAFSSGAQGGREPVDSVVMVRDGETDELLSMAVGSELARLRRLATVALAVDALAAPDAETLAVLGGDPQLADLIAAISSVRPLTAISLVDAGAEAADLRASSADSAVVAVAGADMDGVLGALAQASIVLVLTAETLADAAIDAAIDASALAPGAAVIALADAVPAIDGVLAVPTPGLLADLERLFTDSPAQLEADRLPTALERRRDEILPLASALAGRPPRSTPSDRLGMICVGLAGADVFLLQHLARRV
ncbi:hypothetical protein [Naasia lichenicola]|uniref:Ornithine cyclodeaminase family protein n=1 Tax=Naasia lichenicola TaxID=2565933 RepID=A0A4S4FV37_9MICO|nr:hypothetical protein [Naasia lichenicola]THG33496.1 hypothetical protein E6C64_03945 [Naasia lichenicola]